MMREMILNTYGVLEHLATLRASHSRHAMGISGVLGSHFLGVYLNDDKGIPEDDSIEHPSAL